MVGKPERQGGADRTRVSAPARRIRDILNSMTQIERAIKALQELPEDQREMVADLVLDIVANATRPEGSVLTDEQWAEVQRRRDEPFEPADPDHFDKLVQRLS